MARTDVHLLRVTTDDRKHQLWAAAGAPDVAISLVLNAVPEGWAVALLSTKLTATEVSVLNINPGEAREITVPRDRKALKPN